MIRRHFFLTAAIGAVLLMALAVVLRMVFAGGEGDGAPRGAGGHGGGRSAQSVSEARVETRVFTDRIEALGVARGRRSVDITSSTTELITRVFFTDGQRVQAGQPLVELQAREEDAGILEARSAVAQAQRNYDRYRELADRGVAPRVTAEQAETELEAARASLEAAEARRGDRMIRAPFTGVLGLSTVTPGTLINPGAVITTLDDTGVVRVDFPVPERNLANLRVGLPITATADAYPDVPVSGQIAHLDTRLNETTRSVIARAEFPNPDGRLRPGMLVRVRVQQGERTVLAVPEASVQYQGQRAFVYRIVGGEEGETAQQIEVETGAVENGYVEVVSGLRAGERLVGSGLNRIQAGAPVRSARAETAPSQAGQASPAQ